METTEKIYQDGREKAKQMKEKAQSTLNFRIMGFFILITFFLVAIFEIFYIRSLYEDYYNNLAGVLFTQAQYDTDLYLSYLSDEDIMDVVIENKDQFYRSTPTQVQILSNSGMVLFDSVGSDMPGDVLNSEDVSEAQANRTGSLVWRPEYTDEKVMSLSTPLRSQTSQVGILRLTTSLTAADEAIHKQIIISVLFSIILVIFSILVSYALSRSIIKPIESLTQVAQKLGDGQFDVQADESSGGEIGELARTMNFMSESIKKKETLKNEFISSVSHELRTPLTSIKGWAVTLQTGDLPKHVYEDGLKIIEKESDRLSNMVEELLDFSRFSAGHMDLNKTSFDLIEVTENILSQFKLKAQDKEMDIPFNYSEKPIVITADEGRIKQVLINIIDNAIKFTDEGGMVLTNLEAKEDEVEISITDTGVGIPEDQIEFVTEKFWKGNLIGSHTGLGLSISEEIIKAHGGQLEIRSKEGVGTTVIIRLPRSLA